MKNSALATLALLLVAVAISVPGLAKPSSARPSRAGQRPEDKYKEAMGHVKQAKALLRDYLADKPTGDAAYFAPIQLKALEGAMVNPMPIVPVPLSYDVRWRVLSVDAQDGGTRVRLEIENTSETREEGFNQFMSSPLVIVANKKVYAQKPGGIVPSAKVRGGNAGSSWNLQPTQSITVDVYFEALDDGVTEGVVKYATANSDNPPRFSLLNPNQNPPKP